MRQFDQGQEVRIGFTFKNFAGVLADPTVVQVFIEREADGVWVMYDYDSDSSSSSSFTSEIVKTAVGVYYLDVDTSAMSGVYKWRVRGTGAVKSAKQGKFYIIPLDPDDSDSSS